MVIGTLAVSLLATPWIAITLPFLMASFYYLQRFYLRTSRQIRLLDIEAKSPLYTHFQETLAGIATIRAFSWESDFKSENDKLLAVSQRPYYFLATIQRWLAMILDFIVAFFAITVALVAVQLKSTLNPGYIGLALLNTVSRVITIKGRGLLILTPSIDGYRRMAQNGDSVLHPTGDLPWRHRSNAQL